MWTLVAPIWGEETPTEGAHPVKHEAQTQQRHGANLCGFGAHGIKVFLLAQVSKEGMDFETLIQQPAKDARSIQATAGAPETNLWPRQACVATVHTTPLHVPHLYRRTARLTPDSVAIVRTAGTVTLMRGTTAAHAERPKEDRKREEDCSMMSKL